MITPAMPVTPQQRELLRRALVDTVHYRDPPLRCEACERLGLLCHECAAGLAHARSYLALSRQLGIDERQ